MHGLQCVHMSLMAPKRFFQFSPPNYLTLKAAGLNLSDHSVKVMEVKEHRSMLIPTKYGNRTIPDGVVVMGDIKDPRSLQDILKKVKKDFDLDFIRTSIPEEQAYIFTTEVPIAALNNLKETVEFGLQDHVPLAPGEAVFDCDVIGLHKKKGVALVNVSVLPRHIIEEYMSLFSGVGLVPLSFEMEGQTLARALVPRGSKKTYFITDVGRTRTGLSVEANGILSYTSTLDFGGDVFTQSFEHILGISADEADALKQEVGFKYNENKEVRQSLKQGVERLAAEINRRLDYWDSHHVKEGMAKALKDLFLLAVTPHCLGLKII